MVPYIDFQFVLPKTEGLPIWWWFGWLGIGSVSVYMLFTWWYSRQAIREDELAALEEAEERQHGGASHGEGQGQSGQEGSSGTA